MAANTAGPIPEAAAPPGDADPDRPASLVRTAVVFVHGVGEKRPMQTLDDFVKMALPPRSTPGEKRWDYYPLPADVTASYEARGFASLPIGAVGMRAGEPTESEKGPTDIYEYHWSFLMTANKFAGVMPTTLRLFLRRPGNVPDALFGVWRSVWAVLSAILLAIPALFATGYALNSDVPVWIIGLATSAVVLIFWFGLYRVLPKAFVNTTTAPLVDAARYLDPTPYSYAARRAIRGGLVDLLHALHDGRYSRVVLVAHGVGTHVAYDALTSFWADTHKLHAGPPLSSQTPIPVKLEALDSLEASADRLIADSDAPGAQQEFQDLQFALWEDLRRQGNPWRITDFVTVGAPMALADLLMARPSLSSGFKGSDAACRRDLFEGLMRRGALVGCPPRSDAQSVGSCGHTPASYRWKDSKEREVLGPQSPFAVTRWTNYWFPVIRGSSRGDWFGGALGPLFGPGIRDVQVAGNQPERFKRGSAHTEYFSHPDKGDEGDMAWHIRRTLAL